MAQGEASPELTEGWGAPSLASRELQEHPEARASVGASGQTDSNETSVTDPRTP